MKRDASLHYAEGLLNTLGDWKYLFALFAIELIVLWFVCRKERGYDRIIFVLIAIEIAHETLYRYGLVPYMNWYIHIKLAYVADVLRYQTYLYWTLSIATGAWYWIYGRQVSSPQAAQAAWYESPRFVLYLPIALIALFAVGQQVFGFISGYWLVQESDSPRILEYARIFLNTDFRTFVDTWMLPFNYYQNIELDMPMVAIVWSFIYWILSLFITPVTTASGVASGPIIDLASHLTASFFWVLSIWATYLLGRELFNKRVGTYGAMFLAFIPYYSFMGYFLMTDVPFTALATLGTYCFIKSVKEDSLWYGLLSGALLIIALMTKVLALYYISIFLLFYLLFRKGLQWKPIVAASISFLVGVAIILAILINYYGDEWWNLVIAFVKRKKHIMDMESGRMRQGYVSLYHQGVISAFFYARYITAYLGFGLIALAMAALFMRFREGLGKAKEHIFLTIWPLGFLIYFSFQLTKSSRWLFSVYPAIAILAAYAFVKLLEKRETRGAAYILLLFILVEMLGRHISYYYSQVSLIWILREYAIF